LEVGIKVISGSSDKSPKATFSGCLTLEMRLPKRMIEGSRLLRGLSPPEFRHDHSKQ
jgi:hypothetical protein